MYFLHVNTWVFLQSIGYAFLKYTNLFLLSPNKIRTNFVTPSHWLSKWLIYMAIWTKISSTPNFYIKRRFNLRKFALEPSVMNYYNITFLFLVTWIDISHVPIVENLASATSRMFVVPRSSNLCQDYFVLKSAVNDKFQARSLFLCL